MVHTPDIVALAGLAAEVLVRQEGQEVNLVARVLAGRAVVALLGARLLIPVDVVNTSGAVLLKLVNLALAQGRHGHGVGRIEGLKLLGIELGGLDLLGNADGRQAGEEEGSDAGLHLDFNI